MLQTWLRDAVLAAMCVLGMAYGVEYASEIRATARTILRDVQTALKHRHLIPRPVPHEVVASPRPRPSGTVTTATVTTVRKPRTPVVSPTVVGRSTSVRLVPPAGRRSTQGFVQCPNPFQQPCEWMWVPIAACENW